ncbi:MAG: RsiV family protein [Desulfobaccales bacterium]
MSLKRGFGSKLVFLMILAICGVALGSTGLLAKTQGNIGPVDPHEQIIEHANNTDIEVYYPVTRNKEINKKLATFAARQVADFKKNLPAVMRLSGIRNQLDISFKTYQYSSNIKTFKFDLFGYTVGLAHPWNNIVTKTYDLAKGKELSLADIFKKNSAYLQELSEQSIRSLIMQMPNGDKRLIREGAAPKAGNFDRFALTEKELIIFFNTYQVGTRPEGSPEVRLPYASLKSFIEPDSGRRR